jgi:hypothetical protein
LALLFGNMSEVNFFHDLTRIRLLIAIYFLLLREESDQKAARRELCRTIRHLGSGILFGAWRRRPLERSKSLSRCF